MKLAKILNTALLFSFLALVLAAPVYAVTQPYNASAELNKTSNSGLQTGSMGEFVSRIVKYALGIVGIVLIILLIIGGFIYMTSQGNEESIEKAKKLITSAIIGLIIVVVAYILSDYVISAVFFRGK